MGVLQGVTNNDIEKWKRLEKKKKKNCPKTWIRKTEERKI